MKPFKRKGFIFLVALCVFLTSSTVFAEEKVLSKSVRLSSYEGSVNVYKAGKALSELSEGMRLFDNYSVKTAQKAYAYLELDDSKFVKVDQSSNIKIQKKGKNNTLLVQSGGLFFNVTKPLEADETLKVRTANMTMGVRGTTGSVCTRPIYDAPSQSVRIVVDAQIYTGKGYLTIANETTGLQEEHEIEPGSHIVVTLGDDLDSQSIIVEPLAVNGNQIPAIAQGELLKLPDVLEKIKQTTNIDVDSLQKTYEQKKQIEETNAEQIFAKAQTATQMQPVLSAATVVPYDKNVQNNNQQSSDNSSNHDHNGNNSGNDNNDNNDTSDGNNNDSDGGNENDGDDDGDDNDGDHGNDGDDNDGSDPAPPPADNSEASINNKSFSTLEEAMAEVQPGQTVILLKNKVTVNPMTLPGGVTLHIPDNIKLNLTQPLSIYGKLTIAEHGKLTAPIGGTFAIFENGSVSAQGSNTIFSDAEGSMLDASTSLPVAQYYYLNNAGTHSWQAVSDLSQENGFVDDIPENYLIRIPQGKTITMADDWTWIISGRLILDGRFDGPSNNQSQSLIEIKHTGTVYIGENSNFVDFNGNQLTGAIGKGVYQWDKQDHLWKPFDAAASIGDTLYKTLEEALAAAQPQDVVELIAKPNQQTTIYVTSAIIPSDVTLVVGSGICITTDSNAMGNVEKRRIVNNGTIQLLGIASNKAEFIVTPLCQVLNFGNINVSENGVLAIDSLGSISNFNAIEINGELDYDPEDSQLMGATDEQNALVSSITFGDNPILNFQTDSFYDSSGNMIVNTEALYSKTFYWQKTINNQGIWQLQN